MSALPPVFIEFLGKSTGFMATAKGVKSELKAVQRDGGGNMAKLGAVGKAALIGIGVAAAGTAIKTVKMAADFQTGMTRVRTGAGEAAKNMALVSNGVLTMAGQVGQSTSQLTAGLYTVESAGFHGADALAVLRTSAMGAKVGAADLATVTDAVTTALNAYHEGVGAVVPTMNALVGTEAEGKTNMEALAGSMASILPVAASAHVKLNEILGAMATMTSQGTSADVAATYLRQTIGQLENPSAKAAATMKGLGLNANAVSKELGSKGLAATLTTLTSAIKNKMGPSGTVLINTLQKAAAHGKDFQSALQKTSGSQKTYIGALATMVGGTKSMMGALELTGSHMKTFKDNVAGIADHVRRGGKQVEGWAEVQKTFNQRMAEAKGAIEAVGIKIGNALLPYATRLVGWLSTAVTWMTKHKSVAIALAAALGSILAVGIAAATQALWGFISAAFVGEAAIGPWVLAIMAVVVALTFLVTHWKQIWGWIKTNIPGVATVFKETWNGALKAFHAIWGWAVKAVQALVKWFNDNVLKWVRDRVKEFNEFWKGHATEIKETWSLLWKLIKLDAKTTWDWLKVAIGLVVTVFKVAWDLISGVVIIAWDIIAGAVKTGYHLVMNIISVLIDVLTGHWAKAWQDVKKLVSDAFHDIIGGITSVTSDFGTMLYNAGADLIKGLINGVKSMIGAIGSTISSMGHGILDTAKSVLGIKSPSRRMRDEVGQWIPKGLAEGVRAHASEAHAAMRETADGMVSTFSSALGIASPSKVFRSLGIWIHEGLVQGLTGSLSQVKSAIRRTETMLMELGNTRKLRGLESYVNREGHALETLATKHEQVAKRLKDAQSKLAGLQKSWTQVRNDVANNIMSGASIVTQTQSDGVALTAGDVLANMQNQVSAAIQFANNLAQLKRKGLSADLIKQIADAGVSGGAETAQALLGASANQIKQLNSSQGTLAKTAKATGATVADSMYANGINAAKGLIKGLQSQEKAIEKQMLKIAKSMERAIKHALGIHSPSRLFAEIGQFVTAGLVGGMDSGNRDVENAAVRMSDALVRGTDTPAMSGSAFASTARAVVHNVHIEVHGSVRSDQDLRDVIQREMYRYGGRNSVTWQQFKR